MPIIFPPRSPGLIKMPEFPVFSMTFIRPTLCFLWQNKSSKNQAKSNRNISNFLAHLGWTLTLWFRSMGCEKNQASYLGGTSEMVWCWVLYCRVNGQCSLLKLLGDCTEMAIGNVTDSLLPIGMDGEREPDGSIWSNCMEGHPKSCMKQRYEL